MTVLDEEKRPFFHSLATPIPKSRDFWLLFTNPFTTIIPNISAWAINILDENVEFVGRGISHSMWKAPTLATAAASGTSPVALPKRQSQVLSPYSITQNGKTSTVYFVADKNGNAVPLYYEEINGRPYKDAQNGGLTFLSADRSVANAALKRGGITQAYAVTRLDP